jgi:hypothetical protein
MKIVSNENNIQSYAINRSSSFSSELERITSAGGDDDDLLF